MPRLIPDFTGRASELQRATQVLAGSAGPILTVTGPSGFGTTTFAIALARAAEGLFDGVVFLPMSSPENSPIASHEAARALVRVISPAAPAVADEDLVAQFQSALVGRRILIVCDDVEGEAQIRPLLPAHGESAMVLTSLSPLAGLDGVAWFPLAPLESGESVRLLESIIPEAQRTPEDTRELAQFCKHVPLGLRIAGNQVAANPALSVRSVLDKLSSHTDRGLGAFRAGDRSLLAAFELSYGRLSVEQQTVFRRLCMVDGSYASMDLAAALGGVSVARAQTLLQGLGELSIVEFDDRERVRLHGFVEVFAQMKMRDDRDAETARARADEYLFAGIAAAGWWFRVFATRLSSEVGVYVEPMESFDAATEWLLSERDDWIAALQRAHVAGEHELVVVLTSHLHWFTRLWPHAHPWDRL